MLTRRRAVAGLGLTGATLAAAGQALAKPPPPGIRPPPPPRPMPPGPPPPQPAPGKLRIRQDLASLKPDDDNLAALRLAIGRMGGDGPLSWNNQVRLHARHDLGHHTSWRFLPWHRMQLVYFERIVARLSGHAGFALPYWNWQDNDTIPAALFEAPFVDPSRWARPGDHVADFMRANGYRYQQAGDLIRYMVGSPTSGGAVSHSGHDIIHMFVGGNMGAIDTAVYDPLFWFHHANVDRIWWALAQRFPETSTSGQYPPGWENADLRGYVDETGREAPIILAGATKDTRAFGYSYDYNPPILVGAAPPPPRGGEANAAPKPPSRIVRDFVMQRTGPAEGRIFIPPDVLANARGDGPFRLTVRGVAQVTSNGHQLTITGLPKASGGKTGGETFGEQQVFALPMMGMGAMPWGHEIDLAGLIPREDKALAEGVWLRAAASRLKHLRADLFPEPALDSFTLSYEGERL